MPKKVAINNLIIVNLIILLFLHNNFLNFFCKIFFPFKCKVKLSKQFFLSFNSFLFNPNHHFSYNERYVTCSKWHYNSKFLPGTCYCVEKKFQQIKLKHTQIQSLDLFNNRPPFGIYLGIATPINKSSKLELSFLLRIIILLHSDWSKMRYFNLLNNCFPFLKGRQLLSRCQNGSHFQGSDNYKSRI